MCVSEYMPMLDSIDVMHQQSLAYRVFGIPQRMVKTTVIRRSSQGALSKEMIKAAFTKNKRLPTPYEDRLYQASIPLVIFQQSCMTSNNECNMPWVKHMHPGGASSGYAPSEANAHGAYRPRGYMLVPVFWRSLTH